MNGHEKTVMYLAFTIVILVVALITVAVTYPKPLERDVMYYNDWRITFPSNSSSVYVAMKNGYAPITGIDLADLIGDIDEAER